MHRIKELAIIFTSTNLKLRSKFCTCRYRHNLHYLWRYVWACNWDVNIIVNLWSCLWFSNTSNHFRKIDFNDLLCWLNFIWVSNTVYGCRTYCDLGACVHQLVWLGAKHLSIVNVIGKFVLPHRNSFIKTLNKISISWLYIQRVQVPDVRLVGKPISWIEYILHRNYSKSDLILF